MKYNENTHNFYYNVFVKKFRNRLRHSLFFFNQLQKSIAKLLLFDTNSH